MGTLTLLVGPNASGKSNALDALSLLSLLAEERSVADLERGDDEVAGLRGGLKNAAPYGSSNVAVGCTIRAGKIAYRLDLEFDVSGEPEITSERLTAQVDGRTEITYIKTQHRHLGEGIADVETYSGSQPKSFQFLTSRLAVLQAITKLPTDTNARREVVKACAIVIATLRGIFILDPVPGQMRSYARIGSLPDRTGSKTSAIVYGLKEDDHAWAKLVELIRGLIGDRLDSIGFVETRISSGRPVDVMVALTEEFQGSLNESPASVMSDGTLRYLSIVATLLSLGRLSRERAVSPLTDVPISRTLVIEEIENGLYPAQAAAVLQLLRHEAQENDVTLIVSTHSPALLDAIDPQDHPGVTVCERDPDGHSSLTSLVGHPNYLTVAGSGHVGTSMAQGAFEREPMSAKRFPDIASKP